MLRSVVVTALVMVVALFASAYLLLISPSVQERLCREGEKALSEFLHTTVDIGSVSISPFNQLELNDVLINDQQGDSLLTIDKLGAGISLKELIADGRIVVTYGEIMGLNGHVTRPDKASPTNMQFIIDAFKPKDDKPPKPFDVQVKTVVMRKSALTYDVLDQPRQPGRCDFNHLSVSNLRADLALPRLKNNDFDIRIKRLSFDEASGLSLKRLSTDVHITDNAMDITDFRMQLPGSDIRLDDIRLKYSSLKTLGDELARKAICVSTPGSTITPADLAAFAPQLKQFREPMKVVATVIKDGNRIEAPVLNVRSKDGGLSLVARGGATLPNAGGYSSLDFDHINLEAKASTLSELTGVINSLSPQARGIISRCGNLSVDGELHATPSIVNFNGHVGTSLGDADMNGKFAKQQGASRFTGHIKTDGLQLGTLLDKRDLLDQIAMDATVDATLLNNDISGHLEGSIPFVDFKGTRYHDIIANVDKRGNDFEGMVSMNDPNGMLHINGIADLRGPDTKCELKVSTEGLNLARLGLLNKYQDHNLSVNATVGIWGNSLENITGNIQLDDLAFTDGKGEGLHINSFQLNADNADKNFEKIINIVSDHVTGSVIGQFDFKTLVPSLKHMLVQTFPLYFGEYASYSHAGLPNDLEFDFVVNPDEEFNKLLKLPFSPFMSYKVKGDVSESQNTFNVAIDMPFVRQGGKIIRGTNIALTLDSLSKEVTMAVQSAFSVKNDKQIDFKVLAKGVDNRINTELVWEVNGDNPAQPLRAFNGEFKLSALLDRGDNGKLKADVDILPSQMVVSDTVWNIDKGHVAIDDGVITVNNLAGGHDEQFIRINGTVSKDPDEELCLELNDVNLDYVFETLNIDNVSFGGRATSKIFASDLMSGAPRLYTPSLFIQKISYNGAVMGDIDIKANFDNETKGIMIDADISQANGRHSLIDGGIYVTDDSLDLIFGADHANVAFLKPYMAAFTGDVQGEMSGDARLFGNFHTINLEGDLMVDTLSFLIDYVNCYYTASKVPLHIIPDYIAFNDIPIHDREGHEARLGGWLKHDAFHKPEFNFAITGAKDFLSYDTNPAINPKFYGTVYGNGACYVDGGPGIVNIRVNMTSAPRSKFTFVMTDSEQAGDYNFITFRDRDATKELHPQQPLTTKMLLEQLRQSKQLANAPQEEPSESSAYNIDLQGTVTPDLALTVIMDPKGGDHIDATGNGSLRFTYNNNDEYEAYGRYTLDKGTYNFTLQDLIIKDFTIRDGSSITFEGDPYAAVLDLEAVYSLNANILDLDESFGNDHDFNRTNVPVHALLRAKGIISQPEISFDLEFPSLTSDAYHKVKSIISTDEMMNNQIIYLLALNRFYTPEYMKGIGGDAGSSGQNAFLTSVASSTIAGQLSNILGKMTNNLSIAPNFRSDKGDLSDVEVDVALSSQLLNNRLLLNGNFGYRDNTNVNSNTNFIGDFDLEYLLNAKGTIRLKAYNHFIDQSYYYRNDLRNALTTQGVGIVWKHDFDKPQHKDKSLQQAVDSIPRRELPTDQERDSSSVRQPVPMVTFRPAQPTKPTTQE